MAELYFNERSSLSYYALDLLLCTFSNPVRKRSLIEIMGADGTLDQAEGMGPARYEMRSMEATFKAIGDTNQTVLRLINELEGKTVPIILPDDINRYVIGRVHIKAAGYFPGAKIVVSAECYPWRLSRSATVIAVPASEETIAYIIDNPGIRDIVPDVTVDDAPVNVTVDGLVHTLTAGTAPAFFLETPGGSSKAFTASGGSMTIRYREAIL